MKGFVWIFWFVWVFLCFVLGNCGVLLVVGMVWFGLLFSFFFSWGFFGHGFVRVYFFQIGKKPELEKYSRYEQILLCSVLLSVSTLIIPKMLYLFTFLYSFLKHLPVSREALHLTDGERVQSGMSLWSGTAYYAHSDSENINYY